MEYSNELLGQLREKAKRLRRGVIECIGVGNAGHVGGGCSCADIVAALYFYKMRYDPKDPAKKDRDRFLLSKGHAAIVQYAALAEAGFFPREELPKTKSLGAMLQGHPDRLKTPGVEAGTGSLGQGLSIGLGMALAQRLDGLDSNTYVILGDGEIAEGQIWEAAMAAVVHKADNLVAIVDQNRPRHVGDPHRPGHRGEERKAYGHHRPHRQRQGRELRGERSILPQRHIEPGAVQPGSGRAGITEEEAGWNSTINERPMERLSWTWVREIPM